MPNITNPGAKAIIVLDQAGNALQVYVANKNAGAPLIDVTGNGVPGLPGPGHNKVVDMAFFEGNCVTIGGVKYCNP